VADGYISAAMARLAGKSGERPDNVHLAAAGDAGAGCPGPQPAGAGGPVTVGRK
jgi:hypothetical protein